MRKTIDLDEMRGAAEAACDLLKGLSNPERLLLLCQMSQGEYCVSELEEMLGIRQPTLSQQLGVLRERGLVSTRREGTQVFYRVASPQALAVLRLLYQLYCPC